MAFSGSSHWTASVLTGAEMGCTIAPDLSVPIHKWGLRREEVTKQRKVRIRRSSDMPQIPCNQLLAFPFFSSFLP